MKHFLLLLSICTLSLTLFAQNIGVGTDAPDASAMMDITSADKGILVPRMSATARQSISAPAVGLMVFDSTNNGFYYFTGNGWLELLAGNIDRIVDADGDTQIHVEEGPDEDMIRFDVGGTERMVLDASGDLVVSGMRLEQFGTSTKLYKDSSPDGYLEFLGTNSTRLNADVHLHLQADEQTRIYISRFDSISLLDRTTFHDDVRFSSLVTDGTAQKVLLADPSGIVRYTDLAPLKSVLTDADSDTKIQVEESVDEDIIRFDLGGTEYFTMKPGRIELLNTGNSVFLGFEAGLSDDFSDNRNAGIGHQVLKDNTTGRWNSALGYATLRGNTTGENNVAIGFAAQSPVNGTGSDNIAIGKYALLSNSSGNQNVAIGSNAGSNLSSGSGNVFIGYDVGKGQNFSNRLMIDNSDTTEALVYGEFENDLVRINGDLEVTGNFPVGDLISDADDDTRIQVEENADEDLIRFDLQGAEYFSMEPGKFLIKSGISGLGSSLNLEFREGGDVNRLKSTIPPDIGSTPAGYKLSLEPNNTTVLTATGEGNVGIGITSPEEKMEVGTDTDVSAVVGRAHIGMIGSLVDHAGFGHIDHHGESDYALLQNADGKTMLNAASGQPVEFRINNTTEMTLEADGDVRIQNKLGIGADPDNLGLVVRRDHEDGFAAHFRNLGYSDPNSTTTYEGLGIQAGRNVNNGVNSSMVTFWRPDGTVIGGVTQNNSGTVQYHTTSDERLKTQITPTQFSMGDLMKIEVKDYVYRDDPDTPVTGFLAQQLYDIFPNAVHKGGDDPKSDPWMVDYGKLTPLIVKAVQDQQQQIELLKEQNALFLQEIELLKKN